MEMDAPTWERFKENAAPLERGRNVEALEMSLRTETEEERQAKENSVRHYETLVRPSEEMAVNGDEIKGDDDPLIHWLSYIKFHQDYFPSDKQSQFLLMERCTRALLGQKEYANDIRFLRVCVLYADQTSAPGEIFRYLHSQNVGTFTALFWIAWAYWAEKQGDFPFAEKIFKKGIAKKAQPIQMLEMRHKQFERRMARHWMNSAPQLGEQDFDEDDGQHGNRGILGSLSEEAFRRNDRSAARNQHNTRPRSGGLPSTSMNTFTDRSDRAGGRRRLLPPNGENSRNRLKPASNNATGFQIYVEGDQENDDFNLDRPGVFNAKRQIPREVERRKENTLVAEPWNERGGLHSTSHYVATHSTAAAPVPPVQKPLAFPVFIDEDCAQQNERDELQQQAEQDRRRRHRDERTFRPLTTGDSVAEKLHKDPLRYVKDPSQMKGDQERAQAIKDYQQGDNTTGNATTSSTCATSSYSNLAKKAAIPRPTCQQLMPTKPKSKRGSCGFDKSLLAKDSTGQEQCFEEQRASRGHFRTVPTHTNFNLLHHPVSEGHSKMADDSGMEIDDTTTVGDLSMEDIAANEAAASHKKQGSRRVLFRNETSFETRETSMNNVSQCSSTVNEAHAVGVDNPEEETINTKLAMKELSMMFSSPALGLQSSAKNANKRPKTEPELVPGLGQQQSSFGSHQKSYGNADSNYDNGEETADTAAFATIMDLVDSSAVNDPNNSVLRGDHKDFENQGPGNPLSRSDLPQDIIDKNALRTLRSDTDAGSSSSCRSSNVPRRALGPIDQDDPLARAPVNTLRNDPGFAIYEEKMEEDERIPTLDVYRDAEGNGDKMSLGPETRKDFSVKESASSGVRRSRDQIQLSKQATPGFSIFEEEKPQSKSTEKFRVFEEKPVSIEKKSAPSGFTIYEEQKDSPHASSDGGDTATLSLFGDVMDSLKEDDCFSRGSGGKRTGKSSDEPRTTEASAVLKGTIITDPQSFGDISVIVKDPHRDMIAISSPTMTMNLNVQDAVDYNKTYRSNTQSAVRRLKKLAAQRVEHSSSLTKILSIKTLVYDEPRYVLPKIFKSKLLERDSKIKIGSYVGTVKQELGRGAYGVVVLMNVDSEEIEKIAVKAQTSTESLAWEYETLQKLEDRVVDRFPYPKPLAFTSLADGALMSMSAASESGLNLVDIVNLYKTKLGENVPELLAMHYTTRMLNHLEMLHWYGKILHCDVKPDNWVLCSSAGVSASELMLVDFGRAVDLQDLAQAGVDAMNVQLLGACAEKDMQCVAMRKHRPWSFDADTYGICASAHVLLFGTHIEIEQTREKRWKPKQRMRRYWQAELWTDMFDTLLNSDEGTCIGSRPRSLRALRNRLETHLNSQRKQLDDVLQRQERMLPLSRLHLNPTGKR